MNATDSLLGRLADHYARDGSLSTQSELTRSCARPEVVRALSCLVRTRHLAKQGTEFTPGERFFERVVVGRVRAGAPELPFATPEALTIDRYLIDAPERTTLVRVRQDSLAPVGILRGDLAVVESGRLPCAGDLVAIVEDGRATLVWFGPGKNDSEELGVVTAIVRRLRVS